MKRFHRFEVSGIVVSVGLTVTQDVHMELGVATQTVTVEAGTILVNTAESQVSELVDRRVWQNIPLEVRNQNTFINLSAGVVPNDVGRDGGAAVNGARPGMGNSWSKASTTTTRARAAVDPRAAAPSLRSRRKPFRNIA